MCPELSYAIIGKINLSLKQRCWFYVHVPDGERLLKFVYINLVWTQWGEDDVIALLRHQKETIITEDTVVV